MHLQKEDQQKWKWTRFQNLVFLLVKGNVFCHTPQFSDLANGNNAEEGTFFSESTGICFTGNEDQWTPLAKWYLNQQFKFAWKNKDTKIREVGLSYYTLKMSGFIFIIIEAVFFIISIASGI